MDHLDQTIKMIKFVTAFGEILQRSKSSIARPYSHPATNSEKFTIPVCLLKAYQQTAIKLVLVHDYCSSGDAFPTDEFTDYAVFNYKQSRDICR